MERNQTNGKIKPQKLLIKDGKKVDRALENAVKDALLKHKRANNAVAVWRDGKVVLLQPDKIFPEKN